MNWNPELTVDGIFAGIGLVLAGIGLMFAAVELRLSAKVQRAQFLMDVTQRYFGDESVRKFYYKVDYEKFEFDPASFIGSDDERHLDTLVYTFDTMERLVRMGVLSDDDIRIFAFQASRLFNNPQVAEYFKWLDNEYRNEGRPTPAHADARSLATRLSKRS